MRAGKLLAVRGVHYLATRFGSAAVRALAFDEKYRRGDWRFQAGASTELRAAIRGYLRGGDLLLMGCGGASVLEGLEAEGLNSAIGVDISAEAIRIASRYISSKVSLVQANMIDFLCTRLYDVILFAESLYYVPERIQKSFLRGLTQQLKPNGVVIVTFAQPKRYVAILKRIRRNFVIVEDRVLTGSHQHLIAFHSNTAQMHK